MMKIVEGEYKMKELAKNNKLTYIILLIVAFIVSTSVTYAFFSLTVTGNEDAKQMTVETGTLSLVFKDGVEIEGINVHPGWNQTKTFTVTNTGTFDTSYNIIFKDLVNQIEQNELVVSYTCTSYTGYVDSSNKGTVSGTCNSLTEQVVPLSEGALSKVITKNISIGVGITHEYTLTLLFKEMNKDQNYNQGKKINTEINIEESKPSWYQTCTSTSNNLNCKIITVADSMPQSDEDINFAKISSDTNGKGLYYTSNLELTEDYDGDGTGERVYYYRGAVTNNNVIFGGYCWRIVRTNEDGSVKLRYNGEYANGTCPVTGTAVKINNESYLFNAEYNDLKYNEYVFVDGSGESDIKGTVEDWYEDSGLINYEDQIANVPYCADKSNPITPSSGNYTSYIFYGVANRLWNITTYAIKSDAQPIYKCIDESGKHTVSGDTWGGTGLLSHPIGLLTADEVAFAGGNQANSTYYLYTSEGYWLISPAHWRADVVYASSFRVGSGGFLASDFVDNSYGALPAVSLRPEVTVSSTGDGSYTNPYVVVN